VVGQAVEQCGGHLGIAEHTGPFAEAEIGGDDDAGALVKFAQQVEEQCAAGCAERQVAQLVEDDEVGMDEAVGDLSGSALRLLLLEGIDQFNGREELRRVFVELSAETDKWALTTDEIKRLSNISVRKKS